MKVLNLKGCCQEHINQVTQFMIDNCIDSERINNDADILLISDEDAKLIETEKKFVWYGFYICNCTYDVVFNKNKHSDYKGWKFAYDKCKLYIETSNGCNLSLFKKYKGGTISIVCNETGITAFKTKIK